MSKAIVNLDRVIQALKSKISAYGLELLQRYPNDLLVHDRRILEKALVPGLTLGWVVGHCHTHLVVLGIHPSENDMAPYLTGLANDDRFHTITLDQKSSAGVAITEISREAFAALAHIDVPYCANGSVDCFDLYRHSKLIGRINVQRKAVDDANPVFQQTISPMHCATAADRVALLYWAEKSAVKVAHTLFCQSEVVWQEPGAERLAA